MIKIETGFGLPIKHVITRNGQVLTAGYDYEIKYVEVELPNPSLIDGVGYVYWLGGYPSTGDVIQIFDFEDDKNHVFEWPES